MRMMKMNKIKYDNWFGLKLFIWKNVIEKLYSSWLEEYAREYLDNNYEKVECEPIQYEDLD
jgi:hypothetical protein|tara:strand:+ start:12052 stop:12234 length:183 start_codon:yes stop_codon:yes gene_type:complete